VRCTHGRPSQVRRTRRLVDFGWTIYLFASVQWRAVAGDRCAHGDSLTGCAGKENIDDMCWLMQELTDMYNEQHQLQPCSCCCSGPADEDEKVAKITRPQWLRQTEQESEKMGSTSTKKRMTVVSAGRPPALSI
jgi:hypothetical protein